MTRRGINAITPALTDGSDDGRPFWLQHAESIARDLEEQPLSYSLVLVGHSGAGPLLPAIRQFLHHPVAAYVFVDAGIPIDSFSRLDLMKSEDPEWASQFEEQLLNGQRYPTWSSDDLRDIVPNEDLREKLVSEIKPRSLSFFTEPIPVIDTWPDAPCAYMKLSTAYNKVTEKVRKAGWPIYELNAGHFHMLVNPSMVAELLIKAVDELCSQP
jgi:hypothetical protein